MSKKVDVYDYVNHPFELVCEKLRTNALDVFHNATKVAAERARTIVSELRVNIAGIEVGKDIEIQLIGITERPKGTFGPEMLIELEWEAANRPRLFPFMKAELRMFPLTPSETQLHLSGNYEPPLGLVGGLIDTVAGHRIAEASIHRFIRDVAGYLRSELRND